ncbi:MAG: glycosyltransferase family 2 protein [Bacteroidota bacterium]
MKQLSVISIAYNNYKGLRKTLEVFENNAFDNKVEVVIVDGGSKDETPAYLKSQTVTQNWVSEPDKGIYDAMNKGLEMATGDYVWFLNSGDYAFGADTVKTIIDNLGKKADALYGETMLVDADGKVLGTRSEQTTRQLPPLLDWKSFQMGMNVGHQAFIIRRALALPYDISYKHVADIDWMIRCLKRCDTVVNLDQPIANFTLDGHSTKHRKASNRERYEVLKKHYGYFNNLKNHLLIIIRHLFRIQ